MTKQRNQTKSSTLGYKYYSPDVNNPYNIIDSGRITMQDVDFPVQAIDYNTGNNLGVMHPNKEYDFTNTTNRVLEIPLNNNNMYSRKQLKQQMYKYQMGGQQMQTEDPQMQYNQFSQQGQPELPPEIMELLQAFFEMMQLPPEEQQAFMQEFMSSTPEEQQQIIQEVQMQLQGGQEEQPQQQMEQPIMEEQMQVGGRFGMFQVAGNTPSVNMELQKRVDGNYKKEQKKNDSESSYYNEEQLIPSDKILNLNQVSTQPELVKELYAPTYGYTNGSRKVMAVKSPIQGDGTGFGMFSNNQSSNVSIVQPEMTATEQKQAVKEAQKVVENAGNIGKIQQGLNNYIGTNLVIDNIKGSKTTAATKAFQKKYGLVEDGIIGKKTAAKMSEVFGTEIKPFSKFKGVTKPVIPILPPPVNPVIPPVVVNPPIVPQNADYTPMFTDTNNIRTSDGETEMRKLLPNYPKNKRIEIESYGKDKNGNLVKRLQDGTTLPIDKTEYNLLMKRLKPTTYDSRGYGHFGR